MTSILNSIIKLPRYVKILSTNGIDQNNVVLLDKQQEDIKERRRVNARIHYNKNRDVILAKKKIYNEQHKQQIKEYRKKYWLAKKERLRLKNKSIIIKKRCLAKVN